MYDQRLVRQYPAQEDRLGAEHVGALDALLGAGVGHTDVLPPLWHWVYFLERTAQAELGPDGHPRIGRPTPPEPGLRRMFAGGRVTTFKPLRLGEPAFLETSVSDLVHKEGRSGPLWFVTVRYEYRQAGQVAVSEERDIVYRHPVTGATQVVLGSRRVEGVAEVPGHGLDLVIDETLLFRFSALTYNAHRIHYDLAWAEHEGYGGLVVHGPLQALMMGELLRRAGASFTGRTFEYRLVAPFVGTQVLRVRTEDAESAAGRIVVHDATGAVTAEARLQT
ncbi:MAG: mesaconyl-C4 CoA hydratase [Microthrixaceae bacterium]